MARIKTFRNDTGVKDEAIRRAVYHREQDNIAFGAYGDLVENGEPQFFGCTVGCLASNPNETPRKWFGLWERTEYPHDRLQRVLGIPTDLVMIADRLFEAHSAFPQYEEEGPGDGEGVISRARGVAATWTERFIRMVPVGIEVDGDLALDLYNIYTHPETPTELEGCKRMLEAALNRAAKRQGVAV